MGNGDLATYLESQKERYLELLCRLLRQPSISAQNLGVAECAEVLRGVMAELGIAAEILPTAGQPVVLGERTVDPAAKTVLVYGHYDVQPPEPYEAWVSPPFEPTLRDGRVFARGAADNKGQLLAHLLAVHAMSETGTLPRLNYKFIFEGEEESGSPSLPDFVEANRDRLRADMGYWSDGPSHTIDQARVTCGVRGILYVELECQGAARDLHSGRFGNVVPSPAWALVHLLAKLKDSRGRVQLPGFYDSIVPPTDYERQLLEAIPHNAQEFTRRMGLPPEDALGGPEYNERLMFKPTFNIAGLKSGYLGEGVKTVLPGRATCKIDMRLVPNQDPHEIFGSLKRFVAKHEPRARVRLLGGAEHPARCSPELPGIQAIVRAVRRVWGTEPVIMPSSGGTAPLYPFVKSLGVAMGWVPYGNPDQRGHAPNENLALDCFWRGIKTSAAVFEEMATV